MEPKIEIFHLNFDEDECTSDEWLQMVQQKHLIDVFLFGLTNPLLFKNQVDENLFAEVEVENPDYEASTKSKKEEGEKALIPEKKE